MKEQIDLPEFLDTDNTYSEEAELKKLADGSPKALEHIYTCYSPSVFRAALRYVRDEDVAKDLVQEVFLKVWENRHSVAAAGNVQAYLITIGKNLALKYLKEIAKEETANEEWGKRITEEIGGNAEADEHQKELYQHIREAVALLPEQRQKVFQMAKFEGLSYASIAEHLGISPNTVRNHMVSANRFIRNYVESKSVVSTLAALILLLQG